MVGVFSLVGGPFFGGLNFAHDANVTTANTGASPATATITIAPGGVGAASNIQASIQNLSGPNSQSAAVYRNYLAFNIINSTIVPITIPPPVVIDRKFPAASLTISS